MKINPLNNEDLQTLKEIATRNCTKNISNFNVSRYSYNPYDINSDDEVYVYDDLKEWDQNKVNSEINNVVNKITTMFMNYMWTSVDLKCYSDTGLKQWVYFDHDKTKEHNTWYGKFEFEVQGFDNSKGTFLEYIKNDAESLISQRNLTQSFYLNLNSFNKSHVKSTSTLTTKYGGMFGGQNLKVSLKNDEKINKYFSFYKDIHTYWDTNILNQRMWIIMM